MYFEVLKLVIKSGDFKSHRHRESEMREMMEEIIKQEPYEKWCKAAAPHARQVLELLNELEYFILFIPS